MSAEAFGLGREGERARPTWACSVLVSESDLAMRLAQTPVGVAVAAEIRTRPALVTGSSTHRNEEGRAYTVLVEQGAQIDEDLPGQTFDIDGEVKTHGIGTEAAWPLAIGCHFRIKKARVDAWALVSGFACKD